MKQRVIALGLLIGCIVLAGVAFVLSTIQDKEAPVITVNNEEITYKEGEGYTELLAAAEAEDNRDGNLSNKIFIDKIIDMGNENAVVWYAVMDSNNNVGKQKKVVTYIKDDGMSETGSDQNPDTYNKKEDAGTENHAEPDKKELTPNGESPAIRLKANSAEIVAGSAFDALFYMEDAVDDVDDKDTLYQNIHVDGEYYTDTPGTYTLNYYVTDSSGNSSNVEVFTLTVK